MTTTAKTPATPGTTKPTLVAKTAAPKTAAPKPAAAKAPAKTPAPKAEAVAKEPKAPVTPTRTIKGKEFTAIRIFETADTALVTRVSRALRAGDITAAMRKSKRKGKIRLFILDRQLTAKRPQIEAMIEAAMKEPVAEAAPVKAAEAPAKAAETTAS